MILKAISIHQPFASLIAQGTKTIETRSWKTEYRGDLLILSTQKPKCPNLKCGYALCIVDLYGCRPMNKNDEVKACCEMYAGAWSWLLRNLRVIEPVPCRGGQRIFTVDIEIRQKE